MPTDAIAALKKRACTVRLDDAGNAVYLFASDLKLTRADVENLGALTTLRELNLSDCAHDDSVWPLLARMPDLERLKLWAGFGNDTKGPADVGIAGFEDPPVWRMGVTDNGSEYLRYVPKLRSLDLRGTAIGDATLTRIGNLPSLEKLDLLDTRVTSAGLAHLRGLACLKDLDLVGTPVGDDGLAYISELRGLTGLWLEGTRITDAGLANVGKLIALEGLSLHDTAVTERGLAHLRPLTHLRRLYIGGPITAVGVGYLRELPGLFALYIGTSTDGGKMSDQEMKWLQAELPTVVVA